MTIVYNWVSFLICDFETIVIKSWFLDHLSKWVPPSSQFPSNVSTLYSFIAGWNHILDLVMRTNFPIIGGLLKNLIHISDICGRDEF